MALRSCRQNGQLWFPQAVVFIMKVCPAGIHLQITALGLLEGRLMGLTRISGALFLFLLTGCLARSDLHSRIMFDSSGEADKIYSYGRTSLLEEMPEIGGTCIERESHVVCRFPEQRGKACATDVGIYVRPSGLSSLTVHTACTHGLGPTENGLREGQYITDFHKEMEQWAVKTFAQFQPQTRVRSCSNDQLGELGGF